MNFLSCGSNQAPTTPIQQNIIRASVPGPAASEWFSESNDMKKAADEPADAVDMVYPVTPGGPATPDGPMGQCPVCNCYFSCAILERHVQACLETFDQGGTAKGGNRFQDWIDSTTRGLEDALAQGQVSAGDLAHAERLFAQKLSEVRSLRLLLKEQEEMPRTPLPVGMSPTSMMAADEAMARKFMEEMEREEADRISQRQQSEEESFKALLTFEATCCVCQRMVEDATAELQLLTCDHRVCSDCLSAHVLKTIDSEDYDCHIICPCNSCGVAVEQRDIRQVLGDADFDRYMHRSLMTTVEADDSLITCPRCAVVVEKLEAIGSPTSAGSAPLAEQVGLTGKKLSIEAAMHCRQHRFRCRQCDAVFCSACHVEPYHIGFTCSQYKTYLSSSKCRYCDDVVQRSLFTTENLMSKPRAKIISLMEENKVCVTEGHPAHRSKTDLVDFFELIERSVCMNDDCRGITHEACMKVLPCGHPCFGIVSDGITHDFLPCLHPECVATGEQEMDDYCNICYVESLRKKPCIRLDCGHVFHAECLREKINMANTSARIIFTHLECPLCKKHMSHPALKKELKGHVELFEKVKAKALQRLKFENLEGDLMLKPGGKFSGDPLGFSMKKFAYYLCFKCKQPYFGGHRACEALQEDELNDQNKAEELVCPSCAAGPGVAECPIHGKEFIEYKCKFCCNVANWYCWGTTHFCDECHRKQGTPEAQTRKKKHELDKCRGGPACPLKIAQHAPAGEEFVLGCAICRHTNRF